MKTAPEPFRARAVKWNVVHNVGSGGVRQVPGGPVEVPPAGFVPEAVRAEILAAVLAGIELAMAAVVLGTGAGGGLQVGLLLGWLLLVRLERLTEA